VSFGRVARVVQRQGKQPALGRRGIGKNAVVSTTLRTTEIFRLERGAWKLYHRHADAGETDNNASNAHGAHRVTQEGICSK